MVRYYGYERNVCRGKRRKKNEDRWIPCILEPDLSAKAFRNSWVRLSQKIYEVDPLACPQVQGADADYVFDRRPANYQEDPHSPWSLPGEIKTSTNRGFIRVAFLLLLATFAFLGCLTYSTDTVATGPLERTPIGNFLLLGYLQNADISEASGIAASRLNDNSLWIVNDGGHGPIVYAVGMDGADLGGFSLRKARNIDWEDLAAFFLGKTAYLLIADVGDNKAVRTEYQLYVVPEPRLSGAGYNVDDELDWAYRIRFVYEDGPQDCESVAVDPQQEKILLLSKRKMPPVLYELPLRPADNQKIHVARRITVIENIPQPTAQDLLEDPEYGRFRFRPTAMDITPDGSSVAIMTYKNGYLYRRRTGDSWSAIFQTSPLVIDIPGMRQAESLCFGPNGRSIYITSEKLPAPLYRLDLNNNWNG